MVYALKVHSMVLIVGGVEYVLQFLDKAHMVLTANMGIEGAAPQPPF